MQKFQLDEAKMKPNLAGFPASMRCCLAWLQATAINLETQLFFTNSLLSAGIKNYRSSGITNTEPPQTPSPLTRVEN
jgi:hypothetical protein